MDQVVLFPFVDYWWFYGVFAAFVVGLLLLDLGVFHRKAHAVSMKESAVWSVVWISLALLFNLGLYHYACHAFTTDERLLAITGFDAHRAAKQVGLEFLTGFIIEKSLAIDNIFVFSVVFSYFAVPLKYQHRVLFFGIVGALIFRAVFVALGASLLQYHWVAVVAGVFLLLTGVKLLFAPETAPDPGKNPIIRIVRRFFPVTSGFEGHKFWVRKNGVLHVTPLLLALLVVEVSDIVFAVDSVPAIFAITREPMIVFTSNIFAVLGLRSLYFILAGAVDKFRFLKYGLGLILIFVGLKMTWLTAALGGKFPTGLSLAIIATILLGSVAISVFLKPSTTVLRRADA